MYITSFACLQRLYKGSVGVGSCTDQKVVVLCTNEGEGLYHLMVGQLN